MPDNSQTNPAAFNCEGGLVLNKSTFLMQPGEALELRNFEPDIQGGYRRINGFSKYVTAVVPSTSSSTEKVLIYFRFVIFTPDLCEYSKSSFLLSSERRS